MSTAETRTELILMYARKMAAAHPSMGSEERARDYVSKISRAIDAKDYQTLRQPLRFKENAVIREFFTGVMGIQLGKLQREACDALQEFTGFVPTPKEPREKPQFYVGDGAFDYAKRMSRYGHKDWIVYRDRNGALNARRISAESVKLALLAVGTQGKFTLIPGDGSHNWIVSWHLGINFILNLKAGYYSGA